MSAITRGPYSSIQSLFPIIGLLEALNIKVVIEARNKTTGEVYETMSSIWDLKVFGKPMHCERLWLVCYYQDRGSVIPTAIENMIDTAIALAIR